MAIRYIPKEHKWDRIPLAFPATLSVPEDKVIVEIGPGRGDFLFHLATATPGAQVIAIELKSKRYFKLIDRIVKRGLTNVRLIQADGRQAVRELFEEASVDEIHINFPDPWPKNRHDKNRLFSKEFILDCARILRTGGILSFVTDAKWYADDVERMVAPLQCGLVAVTSDLAEVYPSFFAQKWEKMGRTFTYLKWKKAKGL